MSKYLKFSAAFVAFCLFTIGFYLTTQSLSAQNQKTAAVNQSAQAVGSGAAYSDINTILKGRNMYELSQAELSQVVLALQSVLAKMMADLGNVSNYFGAPGIGGNTGVPPTTGVPPVATLPVECPSSRAGVQEWSRFMGATRDGWWHFPEPYQTVRFVSTPGNSHFTKKLINVGVAGASPVYDERYETRIRDVGSVVYLFDSEDSYADSFKVYTSISKCAGDFGAESGKYLPVGRCVKDIPQDINFKIVEPGEGNLDMRFCNLVRGENYYFNLSTYDDGSGNTNGAHCSREGEPDGSNTGRCVFIIQNQAG